MLLVVGGAARGGSSAAAVAVLVGVAVGASPLLALRRRVKVTSDALISYGVLRSRRVPVAEIADIEMGPSGKDGREWKTVVKLIDGKPVYLAGLYETTKPDAPMPPAALWDMVHEIRGLVGLDPRWAASAPRT